MSPSFKRYLVALVRSRWCDLENEAAYDALREEMDELWDGMSSEERDLSNDVAKIFADE